MDSFSREKLVSTIQRKVGYAGAIAGLLIALTNLLNGILVKQLTFFETITYPEIYVLFSIGVVALASAYKNWFFFRLLHVAIFLIYGLVATFVFEIGNLSGVLFGVFGIILGIQYGMLRKKIMLKISVFIVLYGACTIMSAAFVQKLAFPTGVPTIILIIIFLYLFWVVFSEDIKEISTRNDLLELERDRNHIFVAFGKNIAGVVHNLKSLMMSIDGYNGLILSSDNEELVTVVDLQKKASVRMLEMINNTMYAIRSFQKTDLNYIDINELVLSSVEVLRGNPILRHNLKIMLELGKPIQIQAVPIEMMQVIENLVTNAAEAAQETEQYDLFIRTGKFEKWAYIEIEDRGNGIEFCRHCTKNDCMKCKNFAVGKTSKDDGTGIGIMYVRKILEEIGGEIKIEQVTEGGTKVTLLFPPVGKN